MEVGEIGLRLFLAAVLGAVLGLEREINERKMVTEGKHLSAILGVRTFSFVSILGAILALLSHQFLAFALLIGGCFFLLLLIFYVYDVHLTKDPGITTEIAVIYSFLIGFLLMVDAIPIQLTLAVTVVAILLLSQKTRIKDAVKGIHNTELNAFISFAVLAVVILPFLPNTSYSLIDIPGAQDFFKGFNSTLYAIATIDIINPFKLWLIVVLVTGIDLIGYILERTIGQKKGWLLASIAGGFVSSTATTQSLAQASKGASQINHLLAAAVLANVVSFFQIAFLIGSLNSEFFIKLLPLIATMIITGFLILLYFITSREKKMAQNTDQLQEPKKASINLGSAIKFAFLFLGISIISKIALVLFGESGFLVATGFGSFIGLDAVMVNTAQLVGTTIDVALALVAFLLANSVNLAAKAAYSFVMGKKEFAVKFSISMFIVVAASILAFLFFS